MTSHPSPDGPRSLDDGTWDDLRPGEDPEIEAIARSLVHPPLARDHQVDPTGEHCPQCWADMQPAAGSKPIWHTDPGGD